MERIKGFGLIILILFGSSGYLWMMKSIDTSSDSWAGGPPLIKIHDDKVKRIVFWTSIFGVKKWGVAPDERRSTIQCGINITCNLYASKKYPLLYDAFVFHGRDPQDPPPQRTPNQVYIMFLQESPMNRGDSFVRGDNFYNWSITYNRKSDFLATYFLFTPRDPKVPYNTSSFILPQMAHTRKAGEAFVVWIVGHCKTYSRREEYTDLLKQHIEVDIYGKCGIDCRPIQQKSGLQCPNALMKTGRYKFYLSFENSACSDYITEKIYHPLKIGYVPIVYGGTSSEQYTAHLPPNSYIDVRNFTSPKHLADYLRYLDGNDAAYMRYHEWRKDWDFGGRYTWCEVCRALHNTSYMKPKNINWDKFWSPDTECDNNLLEKVSGQKN